MADDSFSANYLEANLEKWVMEDPSILGDRVLMLGQQRNIPGVGRLDLLGIDQNGTLVIIELKRDTDEFPALSCQKHRIILVAPRLDTSAERIITYLSEQYGVEINAVLFQYARLSDKREILARAMLVDESSPPPKRSSRRPTVDESMKLAVAHGTTSLVGICRKVGDWWFEEAVSTFGGSFRYWGKSAAGQGRMVFGINVAARANPPPGQLDVWIPAPSVAEVTGRSESDVRAALSKQPVANIHMGRNDPYWIRLKTADEARALVEQLREFAQEPPH